MNKVIKLGKKEFEVQGIGRITVPVGVWRNIRNAGWVVTLTKSGEFEQFADSKHGNDPVESLKVAMTFNATIRRPIISKSLNRKEISGKKHPLGINGIYYSAAVKKGSVNHEFRVTNPIDHKSYVVYIGTDNTYLNNWDTKLKKAIELRTKFENDHFERLKYIQPKELATA